LASAQGSSKGSGKTREKLGPSCPDGQPREVKISKTLTQVLRHKAVELGVKIRSDGFCSLNEILKLQWLKDLGCQEFEVEDIVKRSDKQRFQLKEEDGMTLIRASQGHSISTVIDHELLRPLSIGDLEIPEQCVHGTYQKHLQSILQSGLLAGGLCGQGFRKHIHFSGHAPGDQRVISGMRYDCDVAIWVDLRRAMQDGVPFFMSANKVILSPGIDGSISSKYFLKVQDLKQKQDVPLEFAEKKAPRPEQAGADSNCGAHKWSVRMLRPGQSA